MSIIKIVTILLVVLVLINTSGVRSEYYFETSSKFIYTKSIEVKYYTSRFVEKTYSSILRGYCIEEAVYVVTGTNEYGFSIEKRVLRMRNESASRILCDYLKILDKGNIPTEEDVETGSRDTLFFTWDFTYKGPEFYTITYGEAEIPWFNNTYIYIPPRYAKDIVNYVRSLGSRRIVEEKAVNFYYVLNLRYNSNNGLLEKLDCLITVIINERPYILINIAIEQKHSDIFEIITKFIVESVLNYWKYIVAIVLTISIIIFVYRKI